LDLLFVTFNTVACFAQLICASSEIVYFNGTFLQRPFKIYTLERIWSIHQENSYHAESDHQHGFRRQLTWAPFRVSEADYIDMASRL